MSASAGGRGRAVGVRLRRAVFGAAAAIVVVVGAGGAQAAGGQLDRTFGTGGMVLTDLGTDSNDWANAVVLQKDGKIVAAGFSDAETGQGGDFALVRYTAGGKLDSGFGRDGKVLTALGHESEVRAVAVQADGKIVAAGTNSADGILSFGVVRYTTGGKLDKSFGSGGTVSTTFGADSWWNWASAVAIQTDGKIVVAGSSDARGGRDFALVRYTAAGRLDATFGASGKVLTAFGPKSSDEGSAMAVQPDGKIVVAGYSGWGSKGSPDHFALVRYTTAGKLDASFGAGGKVLTAFGNSKYSEASAVAVQADGRIVVAGNIGVSRNFALVRYTTAGKLDAGFGAGGKVLTDLGLASAVAIQKDGKIIVVGGAMGDVPLVRYTTRGKLDASFGTAGKVLTDLGKASAVALQKDGKIVPAGEAGGDFALARYMP